MPRLVSHPVKRAFAAGLAAVALALATAGCGGGSNKTSSSSATTAGSPGASTTTTASGGSAATDTDKVSIKGFAFSPQAITVKVGTKVTWTNGDSFDHTVTADDSSFDAGHISQGGTFEHAFDKAGTFSYHCNIHNSMTGTVTVQ